MRRPVIGVNSARRSCGRSGSWGNAGCRVTRWVGRGEVVAVELVRNAFSTNLGLSIMHLMPDGRAAPHAARANRQAILPIYAGPEFDAFADFTCIFGTKTG